MSESPFANLPRFDETPGEVSAMGDTCAPAPVDDAPQSADVDPPVEVVPALDPNVEVLLNRLSDEIARTDERVLAQTTSWVTAIAEKLFPELSRAFLAEEIGLQLPGLLPESANRVEITAPEPLANELQDIIQRSNKLASHCSVSPVPETARQDVEVSWITGGLTLEFDGLLEACMGRLQSIQTHQKETL
ncbi:MAG: hypothetical protein R3265_13785 [Hyphomonas sp.]|nr:hypothetical protein [Hyphomonas sp.]